MNRKEAEDYIYKSYLKAERFQSYDKKDSVKRNPQFSRDIIREKCIAPCVVVTGSKGKGSVANMISQVLQTKLDVGLMTSPHLVDFCERFRYNGVAISDSDFVRHIEAIRSAFDAVDASIPMDKCVSPMGIQTALALSYFNERKTRFNVFECGKGAKFDDVNNVRHQYAIINSIFPEHTRELGETVEEIAADKSHVITGEQVCVYVAEQQPTVMDVIAQRAKAYDVPLKVYGVDFRCENIKYTVSGMQFDVVIGSDVYSDIVIPLMGEHQARNCALALCLCRDVLGSFDESAVKSNLRAIDWPGRMEILSTQPFVMLDACINSASTVNVKSVLEFLGINKYTLVVGIPDDKDYAGVVASMQGNAAYTILTKSQNAHYVFTEKQKARLATLGIDAILTDSVAGAIHEAKMKGLPIIILGTTSVVSEVKIYILSVGKRSVGL
jgi:dihydrofolate synthase/folylpolyglutamate synthase